MKCVRRCRTMKRCAMRRHRCTASSKYQRSLSDSPMIQSIAFFVYPVADMTRARDFYERILGLKVETSFSDEWIEYDIGGTTFAITTMDESHKPAGKGAVIAFEVD